MHKDIKKDSGRISTGHIKNCPQKESRSNVEEGSEERKKQIFYIILCVLAFYQKLKEYGTEDHYPMDFFETMALLPLSLNHPIEIECQGLTVKDLSEPMRGVFGYWHLVLNETALRNALDILKTEKLIEEIADGKLSYFVLANNRMKDFIFDVLNFTRLYNLD